MSTTSSSTESPSEPPTPGAEAEADEPKISSGAPGRRVGKPLLASEVLKDDLAPVAPWAAEARLWSAAWGVVFAALGLAPTPGIGATGSSGLGPHAVLGGVLLLFAAVPLGRPGYAARAVVMVLVAAACGLLGIAGLGPARALSIATGGWGVIHLVTLTALPAALLFRARYRAYQRARRILASALLLAIPYVVYALWLLAGDVHLAVKITCGLALLAICLSLLGFMGSETTGGGKTMASGLIVAVTVEVGAQTVVQLPAPSSVGGVAWALASVGCVAGAGVLGAVGLFQIWAWRLGPEARSIDVRGPREDRTRLPSLVDWFTRR